MKSSLIPIKNTTDDPIWKMVGGIYPPENKIQSSIYPIRKLPIPKELIFPLSVYGNQQASPIVQIGEKVLKGQIIAKLEKPYKYTIHASTSGEIAAIENRITQHPSGFNELCIIIHSDGIDQWIKPLTKIENYQKKTPLELIKNIQNSGIIGMGGAGFPTAIKLDTNEKIHTLIVNAVECEPYITADDRMIQERSNDIVQGIDITIQILGIQRCLIGIEDNKKEAIAALQKALSFSKNNIQLKIIPTAYPSGGEKQLIYIITGQEVPNKATPAKLGIVLQNIGTIAAIKNSVLDGKPLISRITTLTGHAIKKPGNIEVLIGTPIQNLLNFTHADEKAISKLIIGGSMMGVEINDRQIPVTKTTNCIIAGTIEEFPQNNTSQACIRCGYCAEVCPASLMPQQLYWHAKSHNFDQLSRFNLFDCIECGACSYVCPSQIPLVHYYRAAKGEIKEIMKQNIKSKQSKLRFDQRLKRIEDEKAEKAARRKENIQKNKNAPNNKNDELIQLAIERAKAKKIAVEKLQTHQNINKQNPSLSEEQKIIKKKLSITKAQLQKTKAALKEAERKQVNNIDTLKNHVQTLTTELNEYQNNLNQPTNRKEQQKPTD